MAGLYCYCKIWNNFFKPIDALNCGIGGDKVQNVLWRGQNLPISLSLKNAFILCGTNNLQQDSPEDIVDGIIEIGHCFKKRHHHINIFICRLLSGDECTSINRVCQRNQQNIKSKMLIEQVLFYQSRYLLDSTKWLPKF